MRALLDINVIIALLDPDHVFHEGAHGWWAEHLQEGWASCPISENGVIRIMSNPGYSRAVNFSIQDLVSRLSEFTSASRHEFWPDDLSLLNPAVFDAGHIHGSGQLTDVYLLALAVAHDGTMVTFDRSIPLSVVSGASSRNLTVI